MKELIERLAVIETRGEAVDRKLDSHEKDLNVLRQQTTTLITEVKQIRNALYFMATVMAANIPTLQRLLERFELLLFK